MESRVVFGHAIEMVPVGGASPSQILKDFAETRVSGPRWRGGEENSDTKDGIHNKIMDLVCINGDQVDSLFRARKWIFGRKMNHIR